MLFKCKKNHPHELDLLSSLLRKKQKYPGTAFVIEAITYVYTLLIVQLYVVIRKSGNFANPTYLFRAAQIH